MFAFGLKNFGDGFRPNVFLTKKKALIVFGLSLIFYAKFELVRLIKLALTALGLTGGFTEEPIVLSKVLLNIVGKIIVICGLMLIIQFLGRIYRGNKDKLAIAVGMLAVFNILVLGWASYLLYSEFL
mgnify:FL=1